MTCPAIEEPPEEGTTMSSIVVEANASTQLADLPIGSAKPTMLVPTAPVLATPVASLAVAAFAAGYVIGRDLGNNMGRSPRMPSE
jgi:hypothetical protein